MKGKKTTNTIILNIILIIIAISAIVISVIRDMDMSSKIGHLIIAIACISAILEKKYRYISCAVTLVIMTILWFCKII